jgi:uncharacterized protein (TIGR02466 family)
MAALRIALLVHGPGHHLVMSGCSLLRSSSDIRSEAVQVKEQVLTLCFPTPIWRFDFSDYEPVNDAIRKELAQLDCSKLDEENRAAFGSLHSFREDRFVPIDDLPSIRIVLEYFLSGCNEIARARKWDLSESQLTLGNYWVHATPPGEITQSHTHKPTVLSGVYYVDKPENSGDLVFVDVNQFHDYSPKLLPGEVDPITSPQIVFKADEGTMLVFPAWLPHKVPRNNSGRNRVSVSFNAVLTAR